LGNGDDARMRLSERESGSRLSGGSLPARAAPPAAAEAVDLLGLLNGKLPAFASDAEQRITFWNSAAARLFGLSAAEAAGRLCFEIVRGRDGFGNRFCCEGCPVYVTVRNGERVVGCELHVADDSSGAEPVFAAIVKVPAREQGRFTLIHVLKRLRDRRRGGQRARRAAPAPARAALLPGRGAQDTAPPLTLREREILEWLTCGLQNKEVAAKLEISVATVRNHVHNILDKLGVHSKLEAVSLAFRRGWIGADTARP
jgi:DNA-binding CsgD family transcriptional regulator